MVLIHAPRLPPAPGSECLAHHFHWPTSGWLQIQLIGKKQIYKIEMTMTKGSSTCINFNINKISMRVHTNYNIAVFLVSQGKLFKTRLCRSSLICYFPLYLVFGSDVYNIFRVLVWTTRQVDKNGKVCIEFIFLVENDQYCKVLNICKTNWVTGSDIILTDWLIGNIWKETKGNFS